MKNKRKYAAIAAAALISISGLLSGDNPAQLTVRAGQTEDSIPDVSPSEADETEDALVNRLQMPQKFHIVVDPWEVDGKDQVYSEEYVIRNTGKDAGTLTLSELMCTPQKNSGVVVKENTKGLHRGKEKSLYMEIVFGNGDTVVLSCESSEYQVELEPGEEITLRFRGELNENASKKWDDGDVAVTIVYAWEVAEKEADVKDEETDAETEKEVEEDVEKEDKEEKETKEDRDVSPVSPDTDKKEGENGQEQVELKESGKWKLTVEAWGPDEKGQPVSQEYIFRNTGEARGGLRLSDIVCKSRWKGVVTLQTDREDQFEVSGEASDYEIELEPGEKVSVRFVGKEDGDGTEDWEDGAIEVTAECLWDAEADEQE